jgi:hypothetical protein
LQSRVVAIRLVVTCCSLLGCANETARTDGAGAAAGGSAGDSSTSGGAGGAQSFAGSGGSGSGGETPTSGGSAAGGGAAGASGGTAGSGPIDWNGPELTPGVWTDLTPPDVDLSGFGIAIFALDPGTPSNLYVNPDGQGILKSTDGGSTWAPLGVKPATTDWDGINAGNVSYLDCAVFLEIDPNDSQHIYAGAGTRGDTKGFWISNDGGETWTMPQGFKDVSAAIGTSDMSIVRVDPTDFDHILLASHSWWSGYDGFGVLESTDGGSSWIVHDPDPGMGGGSMSITFLFEPALGIGDANTWLVTQDGIGAWRTTNAGTSWTDVPSLAGAAPHGGTSIYRASTGVLYAPATPYPVRSTDNGLSWTQINNGLGFAYYFAIWGDGTSLFTLHSGAVEGAPYADPYLTSPESDGTVWAPYDNGVQTFGNGPYMMRFDPVNRILYSANWGAGFWALKVVDE